MKSNDYMPKSSALAQSSWTKNYGNNDYLHTFSAIDNDNNLIILTQIKTSDTNLDVKVLKISAQDGSIKWQKTYFGSGNETSMSILIDSDNNVFILGESIFDDDTEDYVFLMGLTSAGATMFTKTYSYPGSYNVSVADFMFDYEENLVVIAQLQTSTYGYLPTGVYALLVSSSNGNTLKSIMKTPNSYETYIYKDSMMLANNKALILCQRNDYVYLITMDKSGTATKQISGIFRSANTLGDYIYLSYNIFFTYYSSTYLRLKLSSLKISDLSTAKDEIYKSGINEHVNYTYSDIKVSNLGDILLSFEYNNLGDENNSAGAVWFKGGSTNQVSWSQIDSYKKNNETGLAYTIRASAMDYDGTGAILVEEFNVISGKRSYYVHLYNIQIQDGYTYKIADQLPFGTNLVNFYFQPSGRLFIQMREINLAGTSQISWYLLESDLSQNGGNALHSSVSLGNSGSDSYTAYSTTTTDDHVILIGSKGLITENIDAFIKIYDHSGSLLFEDYKHAVVDSNETWWQVFVRNDRIYATGYSQQIYGTEENIFISKYNVNSTLISSAIDPNKAMIQVFDYSDMYLQPTRPVLIASASDFQNYLDLIKGSGTKEDPYIIKDKEIDGFSKDIGIFISNPGVFFSIINCRVKNVELESYNGGAITIKNSANHLVSVENCHLTRSVFGLYIQNNNNNPDIITAIISHNNITDNRKSGIQADNLQYVNISDNYITNNGENGISLDNSFNNNIISNIITNNGGYGIQLVGGSDYNVISDNRLCSNGGGAYSSDDDTENKLSNNECLESEIPGFNTLIVVFTSMLGVAFILIAKRHEFN